MNIFLSYPSETRPKVEDVAASLRAENHEVFFDEDELAPGRTYNDLIRNAIRECDLFVFFITPGSVEKGRYTLSELLFASNRWSNPVNRILPIMLLATPMADVPATLRSLKILEPEGNLAAEIATTVQNLGRHLAIDAVGDDSVQMAPSPPKPLLGREQLLEELATALVDDSNRPVSLSGMGGTGKTALASELCNRLTNRFPGGVLWSKLGTQPSLTSELSVWASVVCPSLNLTPYHSDEDRAAVLRAELARRGRMLCVVDDVWPLQPASLLFEALPAGCRVVVTSRSLEVSKANRGISFNVTTLDDNISRQLFCNLAGLSDSEDVGTGLDSIIESCGGLPLALEIAAGLIDDPEDVADVAARLMKKSEIEVLRLFDDEIDSDREHNIESCFSLSYDRLDNEDRRRFRMFGVFATGSIDRTAIAHIWDVDQDSDDYATSLRTLRRRHLLQRNNVTGGYNLQTLLKSYAATLLERAEERKAIGERHKDYYLSNMSAFSWQELEGFWTQIVKAWQWLLEFDLDGALDFALEIEDFQTRRNHYAERIEWLTALQMARADGDAGAGDAQLSCSLGRALLELNRDEEAQKKFESALKSARLHEEAELAIEAQIGLGSSFLNSGDDSSARAHYESALQEALDIDSDRQARCLLRISILHWRHNRLDEALELGEQALILYRQSGEAEHIAEAQFDLTHIYYQLGRFQDMHDLATEALQVFELLGDIRKSLSAKGFQALALHGLGQLDEALLLHRQVLEGARESGDRLQEAETLGQIAWIYSDQGLHEESLQLCEDSLAVQQELGNHMCVGRRFNDLAVRLNERGDFDGALDALERALETQVQIGNVADQVQTYYQMGFALEENGRTADALDAYEKLLLLTASSENAKSSAFPHYHAGRMIEILEGREKEVLRHYHDALKLLVDAGDLDGEEKYGRFLLLLRIANLESAKKAEKRFREALDATLDANLQLYYPGCRVDAFSCLAQWLEDRNRTNDAIATWEEACEEAVNKELRNHLFGPTTSLVELIRNSYGRLDEALTRLNLALEMIPEGDDFFHLNLHLLKGDVLRSQAQEIVAREDLLAQDVELRRPELFDEALQSFREANRLATAAVDLDNSEFWVLETQRQFINIFIVSGQTDEALGVSIEYARAVLGSKDYTLSVSAFDYGIHFLKRALEAAVNADNTSDSIRTLEQLIGEMREKFERASSLAET